VVNIRLKGNLVLD